MRRFQTILIAMLLGFSAFPCGAAPAPVSDPDQYVTGVVNTLFNENATKAADQLVETIGQPAHRAELVTALKLFDGKHLNFGKTAIDKDFNGALRQIVYYAYVDNFGFVYFRFNFKMSNAGWLLANFNFKTETNELLPKDFIN